MASEYLEDIQEGDRAYTLVFGKGKQTKIDVPKEEISPEMLQKLQICQETKQTIEWKYFPTESFPVSASRYRRMKRSPISSSIRKVYSNFSR